MYKHLAGRHDQKAHGTRQSRVATLLAGLEPLGFVSESDVVIKKLGNLKIGCQTTMLLNNPDWIQISTGLPKNTKFIDYTPDQVKFIKETLNSIAVEAKKAGFNFIQIRANALPLPAFANSGYYLTDPYHITTTNNYHLLVSRAQKFLQENYGLAPIKIKPFTDLLLELQTKVIDNKLTVSDFLQIPHPDYPDVLLFSEYVLAAHPNDEDPQYARYTAIDELSVRKDL